MCVSRFNFNLIEILIVFVISLTEITNNYKNVVNGAGVQPGSNGVNSDGGGDQWSCEQARLKCALRTGCGGALNNYLEACSQVMQGVVSYCPEHCQYALVALTSTDEGKYLTTCECSDNFCEDTKRRVEVCRAQVLNTIRNETVPCRVAHWICSADPQCSTALEYYNRYCKSMFHGKKCTHRCLNSISILQRQEKAAKLNTCQCDGHEQYDCLQIQVNMARLCFHREYVPPRQHHPDNNSESNELNPTLTMLADESSSASGLWASSNNALFICILIKLLFPTVT